MWIWNFQCSVTCLQNSFCQFVFVQKGVGRIHVYYMCRQVYILGIHIMPHAHENTLVICDSDSGKIAWSSVCWNIEKSANLASLRSLPTLTVACLSLVWPDLAWVDCLCQTRSGILAIFMSSNIRRTWWYSCIKLYGTLGSISGI